MRLPKQVTVLTAVMLNVTAPYYLFTEMGVVWPTVNPFFP